MYYGLQAGGVDPLVAGNFVQLFVILGICLGYISTYFIRVANKARAGACILRLKLCCCLMTWSVELSPVSCKWWTLRTCRWWT